VSTPAVSIVGVLGLALAVGVAAPAHAEPMQAPPVDEAGEVPEFAAWRQTLIDAVRRRDTEAVVAMADPDIVLSLGFANGRELFRQWLNGVGGDAYWTGEVYWQELENALALGGVWRDWNDGSPAFCTPYTFSTELPADLDVYWAAIVIEPDAPVYGAPDRGEHQVATLSYDILRVLDWNWGTENPAAPRWVKVRTLDGTHEGYIESTRIRSPIDYRACFTEGAGGEWTWEYFLAGD
jgi:hypothetical protein